MSEFHQFADPFLATLPRRKREAIESRREAWGISASDFYPRVERWFANFDERDKRLALKVFFNIQYFSSEAFDRRIRDLWMPVTRFLHETGSSIRDLILVVPNDRGDSADRHAYDVIKKGSLEQVQVLQVSEVDATKHSNRILVFFNDTHGTGNQFLREFFAGISPEKFKAVFVIAVTIGQRALRRFELELKGVQVVPGRAAPSSVDLFTAAELKRIRELGATVYSPHPLGYGEAGLLSAYYFQCPNNTLPIIWANGDNNLTEMGSCPWSALFPYQPKVKPAPEIVLPQEPAKEPDASILDDKCEWRWTADERQKIADQIASWSLSSQRFYQQANVWFRNFKAHEKQLAFDTFMVTQYFGIHALRKSIQRMRDEVLLDIRKAGGDRSDVLLVTTGDEQNSLYHYIFEFLRIWRLDATQVCDIESLSPDKVIDKTLLVFYHTRATGHHFFDTADGGKSHWERICNLTPRATFIAAYAMTDRAVENFKNKFGVRSNFHTLRISEASTSVEILPPDDRKLLTAIEAEICEIAGVRDHHTDLMVAYYFQCPKASTPIIWTERSDGACPRPWRPLFRNHEIPN